jgi:hypothetical protein
MPDHIAGRSGSAVGRRAFLKAGLAVPLAARMNLEQREHIWRTFEIRVGVDVIAAQGSTRLWLPLLLSRPSPFQRTIAQEWSGNAQTIRRVVDHTTPDVGILEAIWTDPIGAPQLSRVRSTSTAFAVTASTPLPSDTKSPSSRSRRNENE